MLPSLILLIAVASAHEGHHGFPKPEFNSTVVHSNFTRPPPPTAHAHGHGAPLAVLNETQVLEGHAPDPLSYIAYDLFGERQGFKSGWGDDAFDIVVYEGGKSHGWLMLWHIVSSTAAYFFALPASIALRSAKHSLQPLAHAIFVLFALLAWATAAQYRKHTPDLYVGSSHGPFATSIILATLAVSALEYVPKTVLFLRKFFAHVQSISENGRRVSKADFWEAFHIARGQEHAQYESLKLMDHDEHDSKSVIFEADEWANEPASLHNEPSGSGTSSPHNSQPSLPSRHLRQLSIQSDYSDATTLRNTSPTSVHGATSLDLLPEDDQEALYHPLAPQDLPSTSLPRPRSLVRRFVSFLTQSAHVSRYIWERLLVTLAYTVWISGTIVYTGICRSYYVNGCLAHLIKGSIFFLYGMLTFARYLGAYADLGWAWNCLPARKAKNPPSAELVESFVIFLYGATNTWMERFGAEPGSPYTAKQIQHISIAVMYFFGGAIGIALELGWLTSPSKHDLLPKHENNVQPYRSSYNPFAALCIGITGIAMAAHHQTYVFQVYIHMLWGSLLALYALARCLTYFCLWLNPPRSTTPSRPPTEALASFLLAGGGLAFISSTEQLGFWAMRSGRDDVMMFANAIVALTFLCFTWLFGMLAFRSWAVKSVAKAHSPVQLPADEYRRNNGSRHRRSDSHHHKRMHFGSEEYEMGMYGKVPMRKHVRLAGDM
ncbi:hypothetical protein FRB99_000695 [Tulasnella sp. 403]|nr:hypothetical protein FRB99_000695 [Tulasnella sp. 403]